MRKTKENSLLKALQQSCAESVAAPQYLNEEAIAAIQPWQDKSMSGTKSQHFVPTGLILTSRELSKLSSVGLNGRYNSVSMTAKRCHYNGPFDTGDTVVKTDRICGRNSVTVNFIDFTLSENMCFHSQHHFPQGEAGVSTWSTETWGYTDVQKYNL